MAVLMASIESLSSGTWVRSATPLSQGCECASLKPGVTRRPPRSKRRASDPMRASISLLVPIANTRLPESASASTSRSRPLSVRILPLNRTASGRVVQLAKAAALAPSPAARKVRRLRGLITDSSSAFGRRHVGREHVAQQLPLPVLVTPYNDVLASIEHFARFVVQRVFPHLGGRRALAIHLDGFQLDGSYPGVERALPELCDRLSSADGLASRRHDGTVRRIEARECRPISLRGERREPGVGRFDRRADLGGE